MPTIKTPTDPLAAPNEDKNRILHSRIGLGDAHGPGSANHSTGTRCGGGLVVGPGTSDEIGADTGDCHGGGRSSGVIDNRDVDTATDKDNDATTVLDPNARPNPYTNRFTDSVDIENATVPEGATKNMIDDGKNPNNTLDRPRTEKGYSYIPKFDSIEPIVSNIENSGNIPNTNAAEPTISEIEIASTANTIDDDPEATDYEEDQGKSNQDITDKDSIHQHIFMDGSIHGTAYISHQPNDQLFAGSNSDAVVPKSLSYADIIEHLDDIRAQLVNNDNNDNIIDPSLIHNRRRRTVLKNLQTTQEGSSNSDDLKGFYPKDCYSLMALNGPADWKWSMKGFAIFMSGFIVFAFQVTFLFLLMLSQTSPIIGNAGDNDNPSIDWLAKFIPSNASSIVRYAQTVSLISYALFPESTIQDAVTAIQLFPRSMKQDDYPVSSMGFSCILRLFQSLVGTMVVIILVMSSETVIEIILNFTAINFISELDELAFSLANAGVFGTILKQETYYRISNLKLPKRYHRKAEHYWNAMGVNFVILMIFSTIIIQKQINKQKWITPTFRVQFRDEDLNTFSGCFKIGDEIFTKRRSYNSFGSANSANSSSFGYCREQRQWFFYKALDLNTNTTPCDVPDSAKLASSIQTDNYDISTLFEELWVDSSNAPLDWFVFDMNETSFKNDTSFNCNYSLDDGICNSVFNTQDYNYDDGDCCASTCNQPTCGRGQGNIKPIFGTSLLPEVAFPYCDDTTMVPITIQLYNITSSRDQRFDYEMEDFKPWFEKDESEWRNETPQKPYFAINCDRKNVLTVYIDNSMASSIETVKVKDGADCKLIVRNSGFDESDYYLTDPSDDDDVINNNFNDSSKDSIDEREFQYGIYRTDPIWIVDYSIFHGDKSDNRTELIDILPHKSSEDEPIQTFRRIPNCYFQKLRNYMDVPTIYTGSGPSEKAIVWLLQEDEDSTKCGDEGFYEERFALATMFSHAGAGILIPNDNQCTWPSIACSEGIVTQINVEDQILGSIQTEIGILTALEKINLRGNQLSGSIPREIGLLTGLLSLDLHENYLNGTIPSEIGLMTGLISLLLDVNQLTGSIPTEIGLLTGLSSLLLDDNIFSGTIPSEMGLLTGLSYLYLEKNQLTGSIPSVIGLLTGPTSLQLYSNSLTGSIPSEIGFMTGLSGLLLSQNELTGSVPSEIGLMTGLSRLDLQENVLTDSIPSEIGFMTGIAELDLGQNELTGSVPSEIGLMTGLSYLDFHNNNLTETISSEIGLLTGLSHLNLGKNILTGSIPSEISLLSDLSELFLNENQLTGSINCEIGLMTGLSRLDLFSNNFTCSIPSEIGLLTGLSYLDLYDNSFTDSIPSEMGLSTGLSYLYLSKNQLNGSIPSEIGLLTGLSILHLRHNKLAGSIPSEIGLLTGLSYLNLRQNKLTGGIPSEIGLLTGLSYLVLSQNKLTGGIPSEMGLLTGLILYVDDNILTGSIPSEIKLMSDLS